MKIIETFRVVEKYGEDLASDTLRSKYFPSPRYGVSVDFHKTGSKFSSSTFDALVISRSGIVIFENEFCCLRVEEGSYGELPAGQYTVVVESESDTETIYVYDLDKIGREIAERDEGKARNS